MLKDIAFIFLFGLGLSYVFGKLKLPQLLGLLLTGMLLGPAMLDWVSPALLSISAELRQIALVIILLRAGLALDVQELKKVGRPAMLMCFVPACFEIAGMTLFGPLLLPVSYLEAAIIGCVVAAASPAVIVPRMLFLMKNKIGTLRGIPQMIMAGASVDDVFVIVVFTTLISLAMGNEIGADSFLQIPISIVCGIVLGILAGKILVYFFKRNHLRDSVKLIIMLSFSFLFMALEQALKEIVSVSGLLAVMVMGITFLKQYPILANRISPKFSKLWIAAEIILFVLVGAAVDTNYVVEAGSAVVALILLGLLWRMIGVGVSVYGTALSIKERVFCMIAYTPKATVQAAIGGLPLAVGLPCGKIVLTVAVIAIVITAPLGAIGIDRLYKTLLCNKDMQEKEEK